MATVSLADLSPAARAQAGEQIRAQQRPVAKRRNKYGAVKTPFKSIQGFERVYDSKREAAFAGTLDVGIKSGWVRWWLPQVTFPLPGGVKYRADFLVQYVDGKSAFIDVKGKDTQASKNKRKQVKALYGIDIVEVA